MWPLWFGFSLKETRYETVFMAKVEKSLWVRETYYKLSVMETNSVRNEVKRKKKQCLIFKVDYEKT